MHGLCGRYIGEKMKIAIIGERFIDRNYIGTADRLSPEYPGPVIKVREVIEQPGGAANVAANLRSLGAEVIEVYQPGHWPVKNRLFAGTQQIARWDEDDWVEPIIFTYFRSTVASIEMADAIIISDYCKGAFTEDNIRWLAETIKCPVFIDTKANPDKFLAFNNSSIFFPNRKEYDQYLEVYLGMEQVLRKDGSNGVKYFDGGEQIFEIPALASNVVSVNGAGDSVIAGFAYATCRGNSLIEAADFASRCAAVAVQKPLTAVATLEEVENFGQRVRSNYK